MPKMKCHHWVGATLSMKNLFGLVPGGVYGWPKNVLHWAGIPECIADLHGLFPTHLRDRGRHRGHGGERPDPGYAEDGGRPGRGADRVAVGRHLLPHHAHRPPRLIPYLQLTEGQRPDSGGQRTPDR